MARAAYGEARAFAAPTAQPTALADTTTVVNPGDGSCTADHTALVATGNGDGTHNAVCSDCGYEVTNEECADADGDSRCDLCGDCLHVATTATDNGDGTHKRTCDGCGAETVASEAHIDTNADGKCDGCGADVCKHADVEYTDNFDNTHKKVCKVCKEELSAAEAHVDVKKEDNGRTDGKCDLCGGIVIDGHQLWTLTNDEGIYEFDNLPGYVLVGDKVNGKDSAGNETTPARPGENIKYVYQPYGVANAAGTALSTSDLKVLWNRTVSVKMIQSLSAEDIMSLSQAQKDAIAADEALTRALEERKAALDLAAPDFTMATPYLTGYSIKVVDDSGEYVASRFHVAGAETGDNSDLTSFESLLTDNVNDDDRANEVYAVVAEKVDADADLDGGILSSAYAVRYLKTNYDLANRMYYKRAFDAGLTKSLPVLIDGDVWNDVDSDGKMGEAEEGIEGAVIRLVRYWYDDSGMGYWEPKPGDTSGDGSFETSGLDKETYDKIVAMADPFKVPDNAPDMTDAEVKAAADEMIAWIRQLLDDVKALPEGDEQTTAVRLALTKLNVLYQNHKTFVTSYAESTGTGDDAADELVIFTAYSDVQRDLSLMLDAETPEEEKGVWRRDYTFTQKDLYDLMGKHDLSKDGLGEHTYLPLSPTDALAVADEDEKYFDQNGYEYIPGAGFATTDADGHWEFMAYGTGVHQATSDSAAFKVLFAYRAEVVSYPEPEAYAPTLQHVEDTIDDTVNSDFDDETDALRPNIADAAGHKGDYTLPSYLEEAGRKAGDLLVLTTLADETESDSSKTVGAYATFDSQVNRDPEACTHEDGDGDGFCDACEECMHVKTDGFCTDPDCEHGADCCAKAVDPDCEHVDDVDKLGNAGADGFCDKCGGCMAHGVDDDGDGICDTCAMCLHKKENGYCVEPACTHVGECKRQEAADEETTQIFKNGMPVTFAVASPSDWSESMVSEILAWLETATAEDLESMSETCHDAIFGKQVTDAAGRPLYNKVVGEDANGVPVTQETTDPGTEENPNAPIYDGSGVPELYDAYQNRVAELEGDNMWSDINWFSSLHHNYGLFRIAQAHIAGIVWQDDNYDGIQDAGETGRIANVPVSLKRYWYSADGWKLDETFTKTVRSAADGSWIFDDLDVAGKRVVNGKETTVLYGFEVTVDDLPAGYGVTHMNKGAHEVDSDLNEDTKLIDPADPYGGLIVLAHPSDRSDLVGNGAAYLAGPNGTTWVISMGVDSDYNDTGLVPYRTATIAGVAFNDPEADGLKDETAQPIAGMTVYLERQVLASAAIGFNGASYTPTALAAISGQKVKSEGTWTEVASQETDVNGAYRFEGLPMVDESLQPYIYRVRSTMPQAGEFVPINVGRDDNNDSDWGEASGQVLGTGTVGITPAMAVLGNFTAVRTTPNAYGHKFNLLAAYDWTPEVGRSVDLGMTGVDPNNPFGPPSDSWKTLVFETPWGTKVFYVKLPQTGDELMLWMFGLALVGAAALLLALLARRREEEEEEAAQA